MNIEWTDKPPTEPGYYRFTTMGGVAAMAKVYRDGGTLYCKARTLDKADFLFASSLCRIKGHWGPRIDFAPYVPPKPPQIEAWVCESPHGLQCTGVSCGQGFIAIRDPLGAHVGTSSRYQWEALGYTNWRKLDVKVEWAK